MKITAKSRYALRVLLDIAMSNASSPRTIRDIALSQGISDKFISRIAVPLRQAGLIVTERGARGGLSLARFPNQISLLDIVVAMDGQVALLNCLARPGVCGRHGRCAAEKAWRGVNDALAEALGRCKLSDIVEDQRRLSEPAPKEPDYCI